MEVTIYTMDVSPAHDEEYMELLSSAVSKLPWEERKEAFFRHKTPEGKRLCAAAGILLFNALLEAGVKDFTIQTNEHGKPFLVNEPVSFNISHSKDRVVCAIAKCPQNDMSIGVDVEYVRPYKEKLFDRCFVSGERVWADSKFGALKNDDEMFTRLWTLKESFVKMKGVGLIDDPVAFNLSETDIFFGSYQIDGYFLSICTNIENIAFFRPITLDKNCFCEYK